MPDVEVGFENIKWPAKCCRCGSAEYTYRSHTDEVVIRTLLSVTQSRKITLTIPVCDRCAHAQYIWFGAAIAATGIGVAVLYLVKETDWTNNLVGASFILAVILGLVGVYKKPIKILKFDEKSRTVRIKIYNTEIASEMSDRARRAA